MDLRGQYDYILNILEKQNRIVPCDDVYGDGSIFNNNYVSFLLLYSEILKRLKTTGSDKNSKITL